MHKTEDPKFTKCRRYGTCCKKGGPALHEQDQPLIDREDIGLSSLYTIRKGELVRDNVSGGLVRLTAEIIKIKSRPDDGACVHFNDSGMSCSIYDHRPVECRVLECWNTGPIGQIYGKNRLSRRVVLKKNQWLIDLIEVHDPACALDQIRKLANERESGDPKATSVLIQMINYDFHLRQLAVEKGGVPPEILDFLFGRPLSEIVRRQFGVKIEKTTLSGR